MKNSNIQWIGEIPDDWEVVKVKSVCSVIGSGTTPTSGTLDYYDGGTINWIQSGDLYKKSTILEVNTLITDKALMVNKALKVYNNPFIVIAMYGASVGNVAISNIDACTNQACCVLKNNDKSFLPYLYYCMLCCKDDFLLRAEGGTQPNISQEKIKKQSIPLPPLATQTSIATYLDAKCSEIDGLIADINKQIETLNELKKSTITEAVTKGLNKNAKLKDSGIQWIGMIPEGWSKCRLKYLCEITTGNEDTQNADPDGEFPFYVRSPQVERCKRYTFDGEGILIAGDGAGAGRIFHHVFGKYAVHQRVYRLYDFKINTSYLHYYLSNTFPNEMDRGSAQSTVPSMRLPMLLNFNILIPSDSEQQSIATYLDSKCSEFDSIISDKQKQISTLEAYKKSLIYEYVTGKKEVG